MATSDRPPTPGEKRWSDFVSNGKEHRPKMTWRCDKCGAEYDFFTYGGPCAEEGCDGELHHRKVVPHA